MDTTRSIYTMARQARTLRRGQIDGGRWFAPATWTPCSPSPWRTNGLGPRAGSVGHYVAFSWCGPRACRHDFTPVSPHTAAARPLPRPLTLVPCQRPRSWRVDEQGNVLSCLARGLSGRVRGAEGEPQGDELASGEPQTSEVER